MDSLHLTAQSYDKVISIYQSWPISRFIQPKKYSQSDKQADQSATLFKPENILNFITKQHFFEIFFNVICLYTLNPFAINLYSSLFLKPIVNYWFQLNQDEQEPNRTEPSQVQTEPITPATNRL